MVIWLKTQQLLEIYLNPSRFLLRVWYTNQIPLIVKTCYLKGIVKNA